MTSYFVRAEPKSMSCQGSQGLRRREKITSRRRSHFHADIGGGVTFSSCGGERSLAIGDAPIEQPRAHRDHQDEPNEKHAVRRCRAE